MAKRSSKKAILGGFEFTKIDPYGGGSADNQAQTTLPLLSILPDPEQPRCFLPPDLYSVLYSGDMEAKMVVQAWLKRAREPGASPNIVESVENLLQLASTIAHGGLINPITVRELPDSFDENVPNGVEYLVVTGERRWWAHVLLMAQKKLVAGSDKPDEIKATVTTNPNIRALQLIENVARDDLSLIEKAQGMVALKSELSELRGETVKWSEVENILGISRSYRSRLLKVLKLAPESQELVSRYNLSEKTLRPVTEQLQASPDLQQKALQQIIAWQLSDDESVSYKRVAAYVETLLTNTAQPKRKRQERPDASWWVSHFQQRVDGAVKMLEKLPDEQRSTVKQMIAAGNEDTIIRIRTLRDELTTLLKQVSG